PKYDVALAVKAGADVVVLDGMQGGTGATQDVFIEHAGIPTLPALRQAVEALIELDMHRKVQLVISGGIRSGADVAKALAMGADAGPRLRQEPRPQPRARGPRRPHRRGGGDGRRAAGGNRLGAGTEVDRKKIVGAGLAPARGRGQAPPLQLGH